MLLSAARPTAHTSLADTPATPSSSLAPGGRGLVAPRQVRPQVGVLVASGIEPKMDAVPETLGLVISWLALVEAEVRARANRASKSPMNKKGALLCTPFLADIFAPSERIARRCHVQHIVSQ